MGHSVSFWLYARADFARERAATHQMLSASQRAQVFVFLYFLVSCAAQACFAQGGPPLATDDPGTPGNKQWEINVALTLERLGSETDLEAPSLDFNYGAGDHLQLNLELPYAVQTSDSFTRSGAGNSRVGVKWRFLDEASHGIAVSTYPHLTLNNPTASVRRGLADDGWQMFLPIELSKTFGKFELNGEAGYNIQQHRRDELWLGLAAGFLASKRVELLTELHTIESRYFAGNESVFDFGSRIRLTKFNTLLFAAGRSLPGSTDGQPRFFMYSGLQFTF